MIRGKQTCRILKDIRWQIAEANDIEYITSECQYKGDCRGTCPKCEAEVRYLEQQLERRRTAGKAITLLGISAGLVAAGSAMTSCNQQADKGGNQVTVNDSDAQSDSTLLIGDICVDTIEVQMPDTTPTLPTELRMAGEIPPGEEIEGIIEAEEETQGELRGPLDGDIGYSGDETFEVTGEKP